MGAAIKPIKLIYFASQHSFIRFFPAQSRQNRQASTQN
jgi:hypothetical protein